MDTGKLQVTSDIKSDGLATNVEVSSTPKEILKEDFPKTGQNVNNTVHSEVLSFESSQSTSKNKPVEIVEPVMTKKYVTPLEKNELGKNGKGSLPKQDLRGNEAEKGDLRFY